MKKEKLEHYLDFLIEDRTEILKEADKTFFEHSIEENFGVWLETLHARTMARRLLDEAKHLKELLEMGYFD